MTTLNPITSLQIAEQELTKVNYGGNDWDKKFSFKKILDQVAEEEGLQPIPDTGFMRYRQNNKVKSLIQKSRTTSLNNVSYLVEFSDTKFIAVATNKRKAKFTVDAEFLVTKAREIVQWLKDHSNV